MDDLLPIVRELCGSLASISSLPVDFDAKVGVHSSTGDRSDPEFRSVR